MNLHRRQQAVLYRGRQSITGSKKMDIGMSALKSPGVDIIGRVGGITEKDIQAAARKTIVLS